MSEDLMRYDLLAQDALRGVVRLALRQVRKSGLPGEHHFFIAFDVLHPGVSISDRLKAKYPEEMTIVLQHQFWNLQVHDNHFEVELSFDNIPEKLIVPFAAVKGFFDPHVQFGLQFEPAKAERDEAATEPASAPAEAALPAPAAETAEPAATPVASNDGGTVVSLDAFRKK